MKLYVDDIGDIILEEVYSGVVLKTSNDESIAICMRDSGFEFNYHGIWYSAKLGEVKKL